LGHQISSEKTIVLSANDQHIRDLSQSRSGTTSRNQTDCFSIRFLRFNSGHSLRVKIIHFCQNVIFTSTMRRLGVCKKRGSCGSWWRHLHLNLGSNQCVYKIMQGFVLHSPPKRSIDSSISHKRDEVYSEPVAVNEKGDLGNSSL
jgi:hypothetical protein